MYNLQIQKESTSRRVVDKTPLERRLRSRDLTEFLNAPQFRKYYRKLNAQDVSEDMDEDENLDPDPIPVSNEEDPLLARIESRHDWLVRLLETSRRSHVIVGISPSPRDNVRRG